MLRCALRWRARHPEKYQECRRETKRRFRANNPLAVYIYDTFRRWMNRDRFNLLARRSYRRNHQRKLLQAARWRSRNRDKLLLKSRNEYLANPGYYITKCAKRRRRIRSRSIQTECEISAVRNIYLRCAELRKWFNVVVDHKIPLAKGGIHKSANLQIIYRSENGSKGDKMDYTPTVVFA